jgi:hypothetical protein
VIAYVALLGSAVVLGHGAGPLLSRLRGLDRHPAAAATLWLTALAGTVAAAAGLLALVVFGSPGPGHAVIEWFQRCVSHTHTGAATAIVFSALSVAVSVRAVRQAVARLREIRAVRRRHHDMLDLVTTARTGLDDVCVLDHPLPIAYCLPVGDRPIVVSSGALASLDEPQLAAVLAHERAHLRGRHHLILTLVDAFGGVLPWSATFRQARTTLPALLEHAADDAAAGRFGRATVAQALRRLAIMPSPAGSLSAAPPGSDALTTRLNRLESGPSAVGGRRLAWAGAAASVLLPFAILAGWVTAITLTC